MCCGTDDAPGGGGCGSQSPRSATYSYTLLRRRTRRRRLRVAVATERFLRQVEKDGFRRRFVTGLRPWRRQVMRPLALDLGRELTAACNGRE